MSNTSQELCGLFGKIPQQSDFVTHHLDESFVEHWHHWLQSCLSISQEQLGEEWLNQYIVSPVWNFALMPGVAHEESVVGVMIPNVDQVGRYFPCILAHIGNHDIWSAYLEGSEWFEAVEKVALSSLADDANYNDLIGQLETLPLPNFKHFPNYVTQAPANGYKGNEIIKQMEQHSAYELAISLLPKSYQLRYGNHSLWWTKGSEAISPCLAVSSNLPDPGQYAAMLDGDWQQWGWTEEAINKKETE